MNPLCRHLVVATLLSLAGPSAAAELGGDGDVFSVEVHGFVSQGFLYTTHQNDYLASSRRGSFEFSELGLNFNKPLADRLTLGLQLFARDLGPLGNYSIKADWFHLDYRWRDWLGVRVGRVKLPFGLYNDSSDIDAARVPILLPQSVYPIQNRDFLLSQTGAEVYGYVGLGAAGALDYRAYAGTIFLDVDVRPSSPFEVEELAIPYVFGGRLLYEPPLDGLRVGGSVQALRLDTELLYDAPAGGRAEVRIPALLWVASAEYTWADLTLASEYSRWHTSVESTDAALFPSSRAVSERAYAMASYRLKSWLQPGVYYSVLFPNLPKRTERQHQQHDVAVTARFDINPYWLVKLEAHYLRGTAALNRQLNDGRPLDRLAADWALFMVKTTGTF